MCLDYFFAWSEAVIGVYQGMLDRKQQMAV